MESQMRTKHLPLQSSGTSPPKRSRWFTVDVPKPEEKAKEEEEEKPVLLLKPFSPTPLVCFGRVVVGSSKTLVLYLQNPFVAEQTVVVDKFPFDSGFFIEEVKIHVDAGEEKALVITWTPEKACNCRETVRFSSSVGCKTQAHLLGSAYSPVRKKTKSRHPKVLKENVKPHNFNAGTVKPHQGVKSVLTSNRENVEPGATANTFFQFPEITIEKPLPARQSVYFTLNAEEDFPDSPIRRQTYSIKSMFAGGRKSEIIPVQQQASSAGNVPTDKNFVLQQSHLEIPSPNVDGPVCSRKTFSVMKPPEPDGSVDSFKYPSIDESSLMSKRKTFNVRKSKIDSHRSESAGVGESFKVSQVSDSSSDSLMSNAEGKVTVHNIIDKHIYFGLSPESLALDEKRCTRVIRRNLPENRDCGFETGPGSFSAGRDDFKLPEAPKRSDPHLNVPSVATAFKKKGSESNPTCSMEKDTVGKKNKNVRFSDVNEIMFANNATNHFDPDSKQELVQSKWHAPSNVDYSYKNATFSDSNFPDPSCSALEVKDEVQESSVQDSFQFPGGIHPKERYFEIPMDVQKPRPESSKAFHVSLPAASKSPRKKAVEGKKLRHSPFKAKTLRPMPKKAQSDRASVGVKHWENPANFLPRRHLRLKKQNTADSVLSHRNPYASSNMYYDRHWMEKQEVAFTNWLNYILTPTDSFDTSDVQVDSAQIWIQSIRDAAPAPGAPSREELSLRTYSALRSLNRLRRECCALFQEDGTAAVVAKVEWAVDDGRLLVRKDRALHADLGIKKEILDMLLSYNSLWLRIGLETIYGELIVLKNNCDVVGLSRFIIRRLLSDPEIKAKFSHAEVINYFKPGYEEEMKRFTLKKFLLLVYFLDKAKVAHLIKNDPCLFTKNAKYKCSKDLLHAFSRNYLSGEGDITKHLKSWGYVVTHQQTPLEEFDFSVKNIAKDLRCGLRLGRVVELLFQDWSISKMLRINAVGSLLNKIHNNDVILKALQKANVQIENDISAADIVNGHREKTLDLLWQIVFKTQISKLLNKELLRQENAFLCRNLKLKSEYAAFKALRNPNAESECSQPSFLDSKLYKENEVLQLLLQWCQNVCAHYGLKVHNFTSSFSDGRVLCFLLHHYHPNLLPFEDIRTRTSSTLQEEQMAASEDGAPPQVARESSVLMKELLKNEVHNLGLAFQKFQEIGQIPILSAPSQMSDTLPDEKVTITLVSYVNVRLMELSVEIRAARKILHAWRRWHFRRDQERLKVEIPAAVVIQRAWRKFCMIRNLKKSIKAAVIIQSRWRMYSAIKQLQTLRERRRVAFLNRKATIIQACFKGYITRKYLLKCQSSAILIQSYARMWLAKCQFQKLKKLTWKIQQKHRAKILGQSQRLEYVFLKQKVTKLQACSRGFLLRKMLQRQRHAAIIIQANIRAYLTVKEFKSLRNACLFIQRKYRSKTMREQYLKQKAAAIRVQKWYRSVKLTKIHVKSAVRIQSVYRGYKCRKAWHKMLKSAILIQSAVRCHFARKEYTETRNSIIKVQSVIRMFIAKKKYQKQQRAAVCIQSAYRLHMARTQFTTLKQSCITLQSLCRMRIAQKRFLELKNSARVIRKYFFAMKKAKEQRSRYLHMKHSAVIIQAYFRAHMARTKFLKMKRSAILIQSAVRCHFARKEYTETRNATIKVQSVIRMFVAKKNYQKQQRAAICIQSAYRMRMARTKFTTLKHSCITIQSAYRRRIAQRRFLKLKNSARVIRKYFFAMKKAKEQRSRYLNMKHSAVVIQAYFRAHMARTKFLKMKRSAILIQSAVRCHFARKEYTETRNATIKVQSVIRMFVAKKNYQKQRRTAICIQSAYRMRMARTKFTTLKHSCITIQSAYRRLIAQRRFLKLKNSARVIRKYFFAMKKAKEQRSRYLNMKHSVVVIQAYFRAHMARTKFLKMKRSAILIQSAVRCHFARKEYTETRNATIKVQSVIRMFVAKKKYQKQQRAAVCIQSSYRMHMARTQFTTLKQSCITLQSVCRMRIAQKRFLEIKNSAKVIRKYFFAMKKAKEQRCRYLHMKHSAVIIQAYFRAHMARTKFLKMKRSALLIQSAVRCHFARKEYTETRNATVKVQSVIRMFVAKKKYQKQQRAAICIQSAYRMHMARTQFTTLKQSCITLQSLCRMRIAQKRFLEIKNSAKVIRKYFFAMKKAKEQRCRYLHMKHSAVIIQAYFRAHMARTKFLKMKRSAILIQSAVRCHFARKEYTETRNATIKVQSVIRMFVAKKKYQKQQRATICIQSAYRMHMARTQFTTLKQSCITLQSLCRMRIAQKRFLEIKNSAKVIRKYFFAMKKAKEQRSRYLLMKHSAVIIQAYFRAHMARTKFLKMKRSAILIQSSLRCHFARKEYMVTRNASIKVQSVVRMFVAKKKYQKQQRAAICIQSAYRMHMARTQFTTLKQSCITLQSFCRMRIARKRFLKIKNSAKVIRKYFFAMKKAKEQRSRYLLMKHSAVIIQAYFRAHMARTKFLKMKRSAILIQSSLRCHFARKEYMLTRNATIKVQSVVRMFVAKKKYQKQQRAALCIQSAYRMRMARTKFNTLKQSCITLQSLCRMRIAQKRFLELKNSARVIRKYFFAMKKAKEQRSRYLHMKHSAVVIQAYFRAHMARTKFLKMKRSAILIQSSLRCHFARKEYMVTRNATIKVQSFVRMFVAKKKYQKQQRAAICIQSAYRMHMARTQFTTLKQSCITLQSFCRMRIAQKRFLEIKNSARVIRKYFFAMKKAKEQRNRYLHMKYSAVVIQAYFRAHMARTKFLKMKRSAILIQSAVRCHLARKEYTETRNATIKVQSFFRMFVAKKKYQKQRRAAVCIQSAYRMRMARTKFNTLKQSCITLQSLCRMRIAQKRFLELKNSARVIQRNFRLWKEKRCSYVPARMDFRSCVRLYLRKRTEAATKIQSFVRMWLARNAFRRRQAAMKIQAAWRGYILRSSITNQEIIRARQKIQAADSRDSNTLRNRTSESLALLFDGQLNSMIIALKHLDVCTRLSANCCESLVRSGGLSVLLKLLSCCNRSVPHMEIIKLTTGVLLNVAKYHKTVDCLWQEMPSLEVYLHLMRAFWEKGAEIFTKCCTLVWIFCQDPEKAQVIKRNASATDQLCSLHFLVSRKHRINESRKMRRTASFSTSSFLGGANKGATPRARESVEIEPDWMLGNQRRREFKDPLVAIVSVLESLRLEAKRAAPK